MKRWEDACMVEKCFRKEYLSQDVEWTGFDLDRADSEHFKKTTEEKVQNVGLSKAFTKCWIQTRLEGNEHPCHGIMNSQLERKLEPGLKGPGMLYVRYFNVFPSGVGSHRKVHSRETMYRE